MNIKIDDVMGRKLLTIQSHEGMEAAYLKMKLNGIRHLPVIDSQNHVVGVLSDRDVQRSMMCFDSGEFDFSPDDTVETYMTQDIKSVSHDAELLDVVKMMLKHQISSVLITEKNHLTGIITHEDLLLILADLLKPQPDIATRVENWIFKAPVGQIAEKFSAVGL